MCPTTLRFGDQDSFTNCHCEPWFPTCLALALREMFDLRFNFDNILLICWLHLITVLRHLKSSIQKAIQHYRTGNCASQSHTAQPKWNPTQHLTSQHQPSARDGHIRQHPEQSSCKDCPCKQQLCKLSHIFALKIKATVSTFLDASVPKIWTNM